MPAVYGDDYAYYQGSQADFNAISIYASWYASLRRGLSVSLKGNPPIFFPVDQTPEILWQFLYDFAEGFEILAPVIESITPTY